MQGSEKQFFTGKSSSVTYLKQQIKDAISNSYMDKYMQFIEKSKVID